MNILLCGEDSFAAKGLLEKLEESNFNVDCFSKGKESRGGKYITGDVFAMSKNPYFLDSYDIVISYILIKNKTVEENITFVKELDNFCEQKNVKRLIQISSISVYPNELKYVNEKTEIESNCDNKGEYASVKIAVDQFLLHKTSTYPVTFIRPGYLVCEDNNFSYAGIGICLPLRLILLLGNKKTSLPLIQRDKMNESLVEIIKKNRFNDVYLFLENKKGTKYQFLKSRVTRKIIPLPKSIILFCARIAKTLKLLSDKQYHQIKGLFKETYFDSSESEKELQITF